MNTNLTLSKSDFQLYLESPLHLWARKHDRMQKQPTEFVMHLMHEGYKAEALARDFLEKFRVDSESGETVQFQRTFTDRLFTARTDALIHKPATESFDLYEIKSSTGNSPEFIMDAAFQYLIIEQEIKLERVFILHLNKEYVRFGDLALEELFIAEDITEQVQEILGEIEIKREEALVVVQKSTPAGIPHCYKPKDCPCPDLCHPDLPDYSIYDIPGIREKKKVQLLEQGILDIRDVPFDFPLNDKQSKVVESAKSGETFIDRGAIALEFERFEYPLYFLDYETYLSAVPLFDGYHPQQQMVFQYSLHKMDALDGEITHTEHLSITEDDPSLSLVENLVREIGDAGTVFAWNKTFEIGRNKELAELHPDHAGFFEKVNDRMVDLGDFINYGMVIHPEFKGTWSIKNVLPVMVPELSYADMEIGKGDQAMLAWSQIVNHELPDDEAEQMKTSLLEYCKLDTWAMVRIFQTIRGYI